MITDVIERRNMVPRDMCHALRINAALRLTNDNYTNGRINDRDDKKAEIEPARTPRLVDIHHRELSRHVVTYRNDRDESPQHSRYARTAPPSIRRVISENGSC